MYQQATASCFTNIATCELGPQSRVHLPPVPAGEHLLDHPSAHSPPSFAPAVMMTEHAEQETAGNALVTLPLQFFDGTGI